MKFSLLYPLAFAFATVSGFAQNFTNITVSGTANVNHLDASGVIGIGADPDTEDTISFAEAPLYIAKPDIASIRLLTTHANNSFTRSMESIDMADGASNTFIGQIAALNADFPAGGGLYTAKQLAIWSAQSGGLLFLARDWPGAAGPIIFADGDNFTGEVMRITPSHKVGVGGEKSPASLVSIKGNSSIGSDYSQTAAPEDGLIVEGNMGIGTSSPQAQLEVNGNAQFDGAVEFGGAVQFDGAQVFQPQGDLSMGGFTVKQVHVANDVARFALTPEQVNLNDVVVVDAAPRHFYRVVNRNRLQLSTGYKALPTP